MKDSHGRPQSVLVLGGTSEIALATIQALDRAALTRVVLAGRAGDRLEAAANRLRGSGDVDVGVVEFDASATEQHDHVLDEAFAAGDVDLIILASGVLGDQDEFENDPDAAVSAAQVNYVGGLSMGLRLAARLKQQRHGDLVILSSVAGERARRSNFVYGSTKAGLDAVGMGLVEVLRGTGARALVVRPGFVRTRMTEHLPPAPLSVTADDVAQRIVTGLNAGHEVVYAPPLMRPMMSVLRHVPRALFRKLPI